MENESKIEKLENYALRMFYDGVAFGVASSSVVAGFVDLFNNGSIDHLYLIGIPLLASMGLGSYNKLKHGGDKGRSKLERELGLK